MTQLQQDAGPVGDAGEAVGGAIAWIAETAQALWRSIGPTVGEFIDGVARGAGLQDASALDLLVLGVGAILLLSGVKAIIDARPLSGVITGGLGLAGIAWVVA